MFTIALALQNTPWYSHWLPTELLPSFSLSLPPWPKFAAPGCRRHKVTKPQEDTIHLYLLSGNLSFQKMHRQEHPHWLQCLTMEQCWSNSWFWNFRQELMPLPSLSCCQTLKASSSTQNIRNILFFFSQSCQTEFQKQNYLERKRMESRR